MQQIKENLKRQICKGENVLLFTGDKGSAFLLNIVKDMNVKIVFIDTGYHFDEIIDFYESFGGKIEIVSNSNVSLNYWHDMIECCKQRKMEALRGYLDKVKAECLIVPFIDEEKRNGIEDSYLSGIDNIKIIRPLADLAERDIWMKIREFKLPFSRIYNKGYRIVDCKPCTTRFGRKKHDSDADSGDIDNETKEKLISLGYM